MHDMSSSPVKGKPFNREETYSKIVKYYIDKKQYSPERANAIAETEVKRQMQQRGLI